jgi:hypothetical protein
MDKAVFDDDSADEMESIAWSFFYLMNHEFQGYYKDTFHDYLKSAIKGRADYSAASKIFNWGVVEKCFTAWMVGLPALEHK